MSQDKELVIKKVLHAGTKQVHFQNGTKASNHPKTNQKHYYSSIHSLL